MYSLLNQILHNKSFMPYCIVPIAPLIWLIVNRGVGVMGTKTDSMQWIPASARFL